MTAAVELAGATLAYAQGRGVHALTGTIDAGAAVALVGPSGAGKSTLLDLVSGAVAPQTGSVRTLGASLASLRGRPYRRARDRVGVLQQANDLTPLSVLHNVLAGRLGRWSGPRALRNRVLPRADDFAEAQAALASVELAERIHADPAALSGGEQRRVQLARLVFQAPALWLADEPTSGLDPRLRGDTVHLLLRLVRRAGATAIVALHDLDLLDAGFDEIWGLRGGSLVFARRAEALSPQDLRALYEADR